MDPNSKLTKLSEAEPDINVKLYQSMLGSLMYAMIGGHPDLAFSVGTLSKHSTTPGTQHLQAIKRVYRYLRGMLDLRLAYRSTPPGARDSISTALTGYVNADWASNTIDRRSTSGYIFVLSGSAISWSSKCQSFTAFSSTEAKYMATSNTTKEAIWLRAFLSELGCLPVPLLIDNQSAIALIKNPEHHERTKHIDVRYHFIRDSYDNAVIDPEYIPTRDQVADTLIKALAREKHQRFLDGLGLL